ncbi:uncharacterized protein FN964_006007 [Alca torda]
MPGTSTEHPPGLAPQPRRRCLMPKEPPARPELTHVCRRSRLVLTRAGPWAGSCPPGEPGHPLVEQETRGQRSNPKWYQWREKPHHRLCGPRIANSKFANGKTDEVPQSYLRAVVSSGPSVQTPAMSWGVRNEKVAVRAYEQLKSQAVGKAVQVDDCGLFIHREKKWIAASPDGIIKEAATGKALGLVEVKCPYKHRNRQCARPARTRTSAWRWTATATP